MARKLPLSRLFSTSPEFLTLEIADKIANRAIDEAKKLKLAPITVCVADSVGRVIVQKRMDFCANGPAAYAVVKATTCVAMNCSTRSLKERYADRQGQLTSMIALTPGGFAPFPGVIIMIRENLRDTRRIIGAVGVSGASADEDEHCALVGAHGKLLTSRNKFNICRKDHATFCL